MVVARGWEEGSIRSYSLKDLEFQFCKMERVMELDGGDVCKPL